MEEHVKGWTPLNLASNRGHQRIVQLLLEHGANLETKSDNGFVALSSAAAQGHTDIIRLLLSKGADCSITNDGGSTILHLAAGRGHLESVRYLHSCGAKLEALEKKNNCQETPLHTAAYYGHTSVVRLLVENGACLVAKNNTGCTPLERAVAKGHLGAVKYLLRECPEARYTTDLDGRIPLHTACSEGHLEIAKHLLEHDACALVSIDPKIEPNQKAKGWEDARVTVSLEHPNIQSDSGWTPLHIAANNGHDEVVQYLLENEADQTISDALGWTPLLSASFYGHLKVVELLIANVGGDARLVDRFGRTALFLAASQGHRSIVKKLLMVLATEKNLLLRADTYNSTSVSVALRNGHEMVVADLLDTAPPSIYSQDLGNKTPGEWLRLTESSPSLKDLFLYNDGDTVGLKDKEDETVDTNKSWCHVCVRLLNDSDSRYKCRDGCTAKSGFLACNRCYNLGLKCQDISHALMLEEKTP